MAYGENEIAPFLDKSAPYNAGFSQGYIGLPLKGHHTSEFLGGYINGAKTMQFNRGEVEGYFGKCPTSNNPDYLQGWQQGNATGHDFGHGLISLPTHTDDNYKKFYIGYMDGEIVAGYDKDANGTHNYCPSGHTQEYCMGHRSGYDNTYYLLKDA